MVTEQSQRTSGDQVENIPGQDNAAQQCCELSLEARYDDVLAKFEKMDLEDDEFGDYLKNVFYEQRDEILAFNRHPMVLSYRERALHATGERSFLTGVPINVPCDNEKTGCLASAEPSLGLVIYPTEHAKSLLGAKKVLAEWGQNSSPNDEQCEAAQLAREAQHAFIHEHIHLTQESGEDYCMADIVDRTVLEGLTDWLTYYEVKKEYVDCYCIQA